MRPFHKSSGAYLAVYGYENEEGAHFELEFESAAGAKRRSGPLLCTNREEAQRHANRLAAEEGFGPGDCRIMWQPER